MKVVNWCMEYDCALMIGRYETGNRLAINIVCIDENGEFDEPYGNLTVNLMRSDCADNEAYVDINNMPCAEDFIKEYKLGKPTGKTMRSGYCEYPQYRFDMNEVKKYELAS